MKTRNVVVSLVMMLLFAMPAHAVGKGEVQQYFRDTAMRVKATNVAAEKRAILNGSLNTMTGVLVILQRTPTLSPSDAVGIERLKANLRDKQNELSGEHGFVQVPDARLNSFADYVVQDLEQADQVITISLVTLLVGIIILILILR
jgi:hypothetical protein